jgi:hypothetical protein
VALRAPLPLLLLLLLRGLTAHVCSAALPVVVPLSAVLAPLTIAAAAVTAVRVASLRVACPGGPLLLLLLLPFLLLLLLLLLLLILLLLLALPRLPPAAGTWTGAAGAGAALVQRCS